MPSNQRLKTKKYVKVDKRKLERSKSVLLLQNIVIRIFYFLLVQHVDEKSFFNISWLYIEHLFYVVDVLALEINVYNIRKGISLIHVLKLELLNKTYNLFLQTLCGRNRMERIWKLLHSQCITNGSQFKTSNYYFESENSSNIKPDLLIY